VFGKADVSYFAKKYFTGALPARFKKNKRKKLRFFRFMEPVLLEPEGENILQQGYSCFIGVILIIGKLFGLRKISGRNIG
jgi:hypothetical protein